MDIIQNTGFGLAPIKREGSVATTLTKVRYLDDIRNVVIYIKMGMKDHYFSVPI